MVTEDAIPPADQVALESQGDPQEGIKVHGQWTIEVFDPDGKLAAHREFENALTPEGANQLVKVLGRQREVREWRVSFGELTTITSATGTDTFVGELGPCLSSNSSPIQCNLDEFTDFGSNSFDTLKMRVPTVDANANKLELTGFAIIQRDGKIEWVSTSNNFGGYFGVTQTILTGGDILNVTVNQAVVVTVVISFS